MTVTLERTSTKAQIKFLRMSASKARVVLNLVRGKKVGEAFQILEFSERLAAEPISKCLASAVANAEHNDDIAADELFVAECFADEGPTIKRFKPRARGRAGKINKQTCHVTIVVARFTQEELDAFRASQELRDATRPTAAKAKSTDRKRRVAKSKKTVEEEPAVETEPQDEVSQEQEVAESAEETTEEATSEESEVKEEATEEETD